jgi:DNA-directed RNA polymerase specialized sigma24 family protein
MNNWKKWRNYRKIKNGDGVYTYIITVDGRDVEVSAEVYNAYSRSARQLEYIERDLKREHALRDKNGKAVLNTDGYPILLPGLEVSLDKLLDENWDYPADSCQPEDMVLRCIETVALRRSFYVLDADERALVRALIIERKTEREYSAETGIPRKTINDRRARVLAKMKKLLEN